MSLKHTLKWATILLWDIYLTYIWLIRFDLNSTVNDLGTKSNWQRFREKGFSSGMVRMLRNMGNPQTETFVRGGPHRSAIREKTPRKYNKQLKNQITQNTNDHYESLIEPNRKKCRSGTALSAQSSPSFSSSSASPAATRTSNTSIFSNTFLSSARLPEIN